jgi:phosphatidylinositol dimannoside acyltransferase
VSAPLPERLVGRLTDGAYAAGWRLVRTLPEPAARALFEGGARWADRRDGKRTRQLRANLRVATGGRLSEADLDELTGRALSSYARYWREAFRLPSLSLERILADTALPGFEHIEKARADGRSVIIVLPHSGNWDAAGRWFVHWLGGPFMTVAERLKPESLYRRFLEYRETLGMRVVPLTGGERPSSTVLREWLDGGGSACLLVDRDLGASGVPVTFFGRPTTMPGGAALLAEQTGAALIPVVGQFTPGGWRIVIHPEVPLAGPARLRDRVAGAMQAVADAFTTSIAEKPEDWHMLGRLWPDVPPDPEGGLSVPKVHGAQRTFGTESSRGDGG